MLRLTQFDSLWIQWKLCVDSLLLRFMEAYDVAVTELCPTPDGKSAHFWGFWWVAWLTLAWSALTLIMSLEFPQLQISGFLAIIQTFYGVAKARSLWSFWDRRWRTKGGIDLSNWLELFPAPIRAPYHAVSGLLAPKPWNSSDRVVTS